ncbi:MAG TPA: hypothetical protein VJ984_14265 [Xanthomonadales bacterium]|nr:hypothetical protein [Xanthomonadales bacterium]
MSENHWKKVTAKTARSLVGPGLLEPESAEFLDSDIRPEAFIKALSDADQLTDAVKVMTRALPVREAVWWACVCARQMVALTEDDVELAAVAAAEAWVFKPSEKNREQAFELVKQKGSNGAGSMCALAATFSEGNVPMGEGQHLDVDPAIFLQLVDGVVMVSAAEKEGEKIKDRLRTYLLSGQDIACGGNGEIMDGPG